MTRPTSITVIAWIIIAFAMESLIGLTSGLIAPLLNEVAAKYSISSTRAFWLAAGAAVLHIVLAVFMLRGAGWARVVYICITALALVGFTSHPPRTPIIISSVAKFVVFTFFLCRREANTYFSTSATLPKTPSVPWKPDY